MAFKGRKVRPARSASVESPESRANVGLKVWSEPMAQSAPPERLERPAQQGRKARLDVTDWMARMARAGLWESKAQLARKGRPAHPDKMLTFQLCWKSKS